MAQGRRASRYVALCGARVLAASLTTPAGHGALPDVHGQRPVTGDRTDDPLWQVIGTRGQGR